MTQSLLNQKFFCIDIKTVAPKGYPAAPLEIGLAAVSQLKISKTKINSWLIKLPFYAQLKNNELQKLGINKRDLLSFVKLQNAVEEINNYCGEKFFLVAYNAKNESNIFDEIHKNNFKNKIILDIALLAKKYFNYSDVSIEMLADLLNIKAYGNLKRAKHCCVLKAEIFLKLIELLDIQTTEELIRSCAINYNSVCQLSFLDKI